MARPPGMLPASRSPAVACAAGWHCRSPAPAARKAHKHAQSARSTSGRPRLADCGVCMGSPCARAARSGRKGTPSAAPTVLSFYRRRESGERAARPASPLGHWHPANNQPRAAAQRRNMQALSRAAAHRSAAVVAARSSALSASSVLASSALPALAGLARLPTSMAAGVVGVRRMGLLDRLKSGIAQGFSEKTEAKKRERGGRLQRAFCELSSPLVSASPRVAAPHTPRLQRSCSSSSWTR